MKRLSQRLLLFAVVVVLAVWSKWRLPEAAPEQLRDRSPAATTESLPEGLESGVGTTQPDSSAEPSAASAVIVRDVTIRDQQGRFAFRGDVELTASIHRIDSEERLAFPNDGSVFQNRERRLPAKPAGYYREWVHLTPDLPGPGPQRIVTGRDGDAYYTHDHYRTFHRIR